MIWIRFEPHQRFHAVLEDPENEELTTWCGRSVDAGAVTARTESPEEQCRCCRFRLARPYLRDVYLAHVSHRRQRAIHRAGYDRARRAS